MADTDNDANIAIDAGMMDGRSREELIDDMALPFLDLAEKIEAAKLNELSDDAWQSILETNLFLWRFISNFLPRHFSDDVTPETAGLITKISDFMTKVTIAMSNGGAREPELLNKMVKLNLNMCDQILAMRNNPDL
ncbi:MAG: hypothetical protein P1V34_02465 [Alphaproteobacteria bacterium]|nr:hypothetical protein [Alphaproteobacteria bacterium]